MDSKFPKIEFDIFGFALEHKCMIRLYYEDYSFSNCFGEPVSNYVLYIDVVKNGLRHSIAINHELLTKSKEVDFVIEMELKKALECIVSNSIAIQGRKWE